MRCDALSERGQQSKGQAVSANPPNHTHTIYRKEEHLISYLSGYVSWCAALALATVIIS